MPFTYHQAIDKSKIESRLMAIFRAEIETLQALGFDELYFVREVLYPLSGFLMPFVWFDLRRRKSRDIFQLGGFFQIISLNPLLYNYESASYVHIQSLGITLVTRFQDGTALISVNYPSKSLPRHDVKLRFYPIPDTPIDLSWHEHLARIDAMEAEGYRTDNELSLEKYTAMIQDLYRVAELGVG